MDIKQLRYFQQVCQDGSMLKASKKLYISQQALSKAIASMEAEIGSPLFTRTPKGLVLTKTGTLLTEHSDAVIHAMDTLLSEMAASERRRSGRAKVGFAVGFSYLMPLDALEPFSQQHSNVQIVTEEYGYDQCEQMVADGALDLAIVPGPVEHPGLLATPLLEVERGLVLRDDHPLAQEGEIHFPLLRDYPFAVCMNGRCYRRFVDTCRDYGFTPKIVHHLGETVLMYDFCRNYSFLGICVRVFSLHHIEQYSHLRYLPFAGGALSIPVVMVTRKRERLSPMVKALMQHVAKTILAQCGDGVIAMSE